MNFIKTNPNSDNSNAAIINHVSPVYNEPSYNTGAHKTVESVAKDIRNPKTLKNGDRIVDAFGNERYVVGVHNGKILMTGKNQHINSYKKTYTWSQDKFKDAINERGFRLA